MSALCVYLNNGKRLIVGEKLGASKELLAQQDAQIQRACQERHKFITGS